MNRIDTPYEQIKFDTIADIAIANSRLVATKVFGAVYERYVKKFAMQFVADRLGEKPPQDSEDWSWPKLRDYLEGSLKRYPRSFGALLYGMAKAEAYLAGTTGVVRRITVNEMAKSMEKQAWWKKLQSKLEDRTTDFSITAYLDSNKASKNLGDLFKEVVSNLVSLKVMPAGASYSVEDENTVKVNVNDCPFKDVCKAFQAEKVVKFSRTNVCSLATMFCSYLSLQELNRDIDFDYNLDLFANPECEVRVLKR